MAVSFFSRKMLLAAGLVSLGLGLGSCLAQFQEYQSGLIWPEPPKVDPGPPAGPEAHPAPSDAIVLFGGKDLSAWHNGDKWLIEDGVATVRGGEIVSKQGFGDCQLHIEWATPAKVESEGQGRGNSGIYLMGQYELQILDSWENPTYFDGQAGSMYKQTPPLVNASRKPGQWQTYDIIFTAPRFDQDGKLLKPAYITVLHNGVLVQNHTEIQGTTSFVAPPKYAAHADKLPIHIQDHGNPMKFRNIWIRELTERAPPQHAEKKE